jgi:hypothetical protein
MAKFACKVTRGSLRTAVRADPRGPVAQQVLEAVGMSQPYGTSELLTTVIECARQEAANAEREQVANEIHERAERRSDLRTRSAGP